MEEDVVVKKEKGEFVMKHIKGIRRGLAVVGGVIALAVVGALVNKSRNKNDEFEDEGDTDPETEDTNESKKI